MPLRLPGKQTADAWRQYLHFLRFLNEDLTEANYEQLFRMALSSGLHLPGKQNWATRARADKCTVLVDKHGKPVSAFRENVSLLQAQYFQDTLRHIAQSQPGEPDFVFMEPKHLLLFVMFDLLYRGPAKLAMCPQCRIFFLPAKKDQVSCGARTCKNRQNRARKPPRSRVRETETAE